MNPIVALVAFSALASAVLALPTNASLDATCTVTSYNDVASAVSSCTTLTISGITVPAGETLNLNLKSGTKLTLSGTIKFGYSEWKGPLVTIKGSKVTVTGASGFKFDGDGAKYWDGQGDKGKVKPKFVRVQTTGGSVLKGINLLNCPHQCVSINSADSTTLENWNLDVSAGDKNDLGHNTDGFDISSSTNINIQTATVKNQDDCVAINQGSNIYISGLTCSGGHGLSLSVGQNSGSDNTVNNVTFIDSSVSNSRNGIHVKTHTDGGTGYIKNVVYKNIQMSGITRYIINVQEDYAGGSSTGNPKANIPITGLDISGITATTSGSDCIPVYILCASGGCSSWTWGSISYSGSAKANSCTNYTPSGFSCK
ncbi:polygalacturonase-like [Cylas formicarius]|uniref:polygalacturonase-like n=1 Tax=Cylas formicarius TaxID=197179 RepID=UPI0029588DBF|nr:polygalacturonase-like [Cylas formicarius]